MALKGYSTLYVGALLKKINFEEAADMADTDATHYYQRVKRLTRAVRYETHKKGSTPLSTSFFCVGSTKKLSFFIYTYQNQSSLRNLDISTPCNLKTSPKVVGLSFLSI